MANKAIKGITIEINGDATRLDKALRSVNTTLNETQSDLRGVERALKLDPSNVILLEQKRGIGSTLLVKIDLNDTGMHPEQGAYDVLQT